MSQSNSVNPPGELFMPSAPSEQPDTSNGSVQELPAPPSMSEPGMPSESTPGTPSTPSESIPAVPLTPATPSVPSAPSTPSRPVPSTPSVPTAPTRPVPSTPSIPVTPIPVCPAGYTLRMVQNNQSFTDLLIANNVSYNALRAANPELPTTRIAPGTRYCAPPAGARRMCAYGSRSYVMGQGETLYTLTRTLRVNAARLLELNPSLAPGDFLPGRVICIP